MANRKNRKQRYQESIVGRIGGADIVHVPPEADHLINARGGKVYNDVTKHKFLDIPDSMNGKVYEVLSVGIHFDNPIITIKVGDLVQVYRLPDDYKGWINHLRDLSYTGVKLLPSKIEFGKQPDGSYFSKIQ